MILREVGLVKQFLTHERENVFQSLIVVAGAKASGRVACATKLATTFVSFVYHFAASTAVSY